MPLPAPDSTILRAELVYENARTVGHTLRLSTGEVFIRTDEEIAVGEAVEVVLSLRGKVSPLRFAGRVRELRLLAGPCEPAGLRIELESISEADRDRLRALLAPPVHGRTSRVLLVEDSLLVRDVFTYTLKREFAHRSSHVELDTVADAETAWLRLCDAHYDVVLVDHFLPASTGAELIARVRADARLCSIPIIAISIGGRLAHEATISAGADLFLDKPVAVRDLVATIERLALGVVAS